MCEARARKRNACALNLLTKNPPPPLSLLSQRAALETAATVRASADAAYLERDPTDRPPMADFVAAYARGAVAELESALAGAGVGSALMPSSVAAAAAKLGGGTPSHLLLADVLLARDGLRRAVEGYERKGGVMRGK